MTDELLRAALLAVAAVCTALLARPAGGGRRGRTPVSPGRKPRGGSVMGGQAAGGKRA